jgi:SAM-dependent methyltransferase
VLRGRLRPETSVTDPMLANETQDSIRSSSWDKPVESLNACPLCGSPDRTLVFSDLRDTVFGVAPGTWRMHRCQGCATYYLDPRPTRESVLFAYGSYFTHDAVAHDSLVSPRSFVHRLRNDYLAARFGYDLPGAEGLGRLLLQALPARRRRFDRLIRELPAPKPNARLLDVGCGNGEFLARMREVGWVVTGQDLDPRAAATTRSRGIPVHEGPLDPAGFEERFDVITLCHVLEHVHDPLAILKSCKQLLVPGGKLWLATPNADAVGLKKYRSLWVGLDSPRHLCVFSRQALVAALERAGFADILVRADIGAHGSFATSAALYRKHITGRPSGRLRAHVDNAAGDLLMWMTKNGGEELVATAHV